MCEKYSNAEKVSEYKNELKVCIAFTFIHCDSRSLRSQQVNSNSRKCFTYSSWVWPFTGSNEIHFSGIEYQLGLKPSFQKLCFHVFTWKWFYIMNNVIYLISDTMVQNRR